MANKTTIRPKDVHKTLRKYMLADGFDIVLDLKKSKGCYIHDAIHNRKYLDFFTCVASIAVGYNHPALSSKSFKEKLAYVSVNKPSNSDIYCVEMAEFVQKFAKIAAPKDFKHFFYISGGSLAVENAMKTAFDWKIRKNFAKGYKREVGTKVIYFKDAFHGRTGYTLCTTNTFNLNKIKYFPKFNWIKIDNPKVRFPIKGKNLTKVKEAEKKSIAQINRAIKRYGDDIAALIIEPVQGEGGDHHFRGEFFKELRKICDKNEIIFIFDEIQTGLGLTGKWWAYQHYNVVPDIVAFGKKTQVCGMMCTDRIMQVKDNVFKVSSRLNSTWGGNIVDMVRATKILEVIKRDKLVQNAERVGNYLIKKLNQLEKDFPGVVTNSRGLGLMTAFDMPDTKTRDKLLKLFWKNGLIALPCGVSTVRFRPALITTKKIVDKAMRIVRKSLKTLSKDSVLKTLS